MLTAAVALCAVLAGAAGSWSPCGFSMVETLAPRSAEGDDAPHAHAPSLAAFAAGALVGGAITFGGFSVAGGLLGPDGASEAAVAAGVVALLAAAGDALGLPVLPQVRRQVPERWRQALPLPVAGGLYGVLLGLGWTTFVLAFAVYALMVVALAAGDPAVGVVCGLCFGAGRAVPVLALAPRAERAAELLAESPRTLRRLRAVAAAPLAVAAAVLALGGTEARGAVPHVVAAGATDPTLDGARLAWRAGGGVWLSDGPAAAPYQLPVGHIGLGGGHTATLDSGGVLAVDDAPIATVPQASAVAVSTAWVAWRESAGGFDSILAVPLAGGAPRTIAAVQTPSQLGRPALDGDLLAFHVAHRTSSRIDIHNLATGTRFVARSAPGAQYLNPALIGERMLYVRASDRRQQLRIGPLVGSRYERVIYTIGGPGTRDAGREPGRHPHPGGDRDPRGLKPATGATLWTTAVGPGVAYLTRLRGAAPTLLRFSLVGPG